MLARWQMALANLISSPRASACGTCTPAPPPLPQYSLPNHYRAWGAGVGAAWHCPGGGRDSGAPLAPRFPAGFPAGRRWAQLMGGAGASCLPERGCPQYRAELPTRTQLGVWHRPWSEEGGAPTSRPWRPPGPGSDCPPLFSPLLQAPWVRGRGLPRPPRGPICFLCPPGCPSPGASFLRQEER